MIKPDKPHIVTHSTKEFLQVEACGKVVHPREPCLSCSLRVFFHTEGKIHEPVWHCEATPGSFAPLDDNCSIPESFLQPIDPDAAKAPSTTRPTTEPTS